MFVAASPGLNEVNWSEADWLTVAVGWLMPIDAFIFASFGLIE